MKLWSLGPTDRKRYLTFWCVWPWVDFLPSTGVNITGIPFYGVFAMITDTFAFFFSYTSRRPY